MDTNNIPRPRHLREVIEAGENPIDVLNELEGGRRCLEVGIPDEAWTCLGCSR